MVKSGVPQGSVLGPIIFLIYINEIPSICTFLSCFLYANGTKITSQLDDVSNLSSLQNDLDSLYDWCCKWSPKFTLDQKWNFMLKDVAAVFINMT